MEGLKMRDDLSGMVSRAILIATVMGIGGCVIHNNVKSTQEGWDAENMSTWRKIWTTLQIWKKPSHAMTTTSGRTMKLTLSAAQDKPQRMAVNVKMQDTALRLAQIQNTHKMS